MVSYVNDVSNNDSTFVNGLSQFIAVSNSTPASEIDKNLRTVEAELTSTYKPRMKQTLLSSSIGQQLETEEHRK